jgi:hypothetical protein
MDREVPAPYPLLAMTGSEPLRGRLFKKRASREPRGGSAGEQQSGGRKRRSSLSLKCALPGWEGASRGVQRIQRQKRAAGRALVGMGGPGAGGGVASGYLRSAHGLDFRSQLLGAGRGKELS